MPEFNSIVLSDSSFFQKIIKKYRQSRVNPFRFPIMIFHKNAGNIISQNINFDIFLGLSFDRRKKYSFLIKNIGDLRSLISWYNVEKIIRQFIQVPVILKNIPIVPMEHGKIPVSDVFIPAGRMHGFSLLKTIHFMITISYPQTICNNIQLGGTASKWSSRYTNNPDGKSGNILEYHIGFEKKSSFLLSNVYARDRMTPRIGAFHKPSVHNTFLPETIVNSRITLSPLTINDQGGPSTIKMIHNHNSNKNNYWQVEGNGIKVHAGRPEYEIAGYNFITQNNNKRGYKLLVDSRSIAVLSKSTPIFNKTYREINSSSDFFRDSKIFKQNTNQHDAFYHAPITSFASLQNIYNPGEGNKFYFHNHDMIEQAVEQVKNIAMQVKEVVVKEHLQEQQPGDAKMLHQIDINRISNEVYQKIDYRIKIEKERRGIL